MSTVNSFLLFLALVCAYNSLPLCEAAVCYVKPTEPHNATCPGEPCYTLDEYVSEHWNYFDANDNTILFLNGTHELSHQLNMHNVTNLTLASYSEGGSVNISSHQLPLKFNSIHKIALNGLTSNEFIFTDCANVTLTDLHTVGILLTNVFGMSTISHIRAVSVNTLTKIFIINNHSADITSSQFVLTDLGTHAGIRITGCPPGELILKDTELSDNIQSLQVIPNCSTLMTFKLTCVNTTFANNYYGIYLEPNYLGLIVGEISLHNVQFHRNKFSIMSYEAHKITVSESVFTESDGAAIVAYNTILYLKGTVVFNHNVGLRGGAIALYGLSVLWIPEPNSTYVLFENNTASDVGGAIFFSTEAQGLVYWDIDNSDIWCRIIINPFPSKLVFNFTENIAKNGGDAIYGAKLADTCTSPVDSNRTALKDKILPKSHFSPNFDNDTSLVCSDPTGVCLCVDGKPDCFRDSSKFLVYPGQEFERSAAVVCDMNGLIGYPVYASVSNGIELGSRLQYIQLTYGRQCANLHFSILTNHTDHDTNHMITLKASSGDALKMPVTLLPCPIGFELNNGFCDCIEKLRLNQTITCNITQQVIQTQGNVWIGIGTSDIEENDTARILFSAICPFHYCSEAEVDIHVTHTFFDEDAQCVSNRSGVLCGGCKDNCSLAIGSNRCLCNCTNKGLFLIVAFAAAGIALVLFIKVLDLTVARGTLNGLIFYANILGANQFLFSTAGNISGGLTAFLSVFIAWVNLDLGIETCFYDGMDAYAKAWLQFVFPMYVWAIVGVIIILSRYSVYASKLFGNNSVPVLATLILLSYSKLLRAIIVALSVIEIDTVNGSKVSLWKRDGNIQYLTGKHIPLFVFALAVLFLLWFPFTFVLVSVQWLQKGTHHRVLCWVVKLKPLFDAFTGPLKDKHRYWVGALLLARCTLFLVFFIHTDVTATTSATFSLSIILVFLASVGFKYKRTLLTVLELSYIVNIGILAAGSLYVTLIEGNKASLVNISVAIVFLQFLATVVYHIIMRSPLERLGIFIRQRCCQEKNKNESYSYTLNSHEESCPADERRPLVKTSHEIEAYREPVLEFLNSNK